ncbi:MAG TPA: hypothetical protein DF383_12245 [Deltaproteobacteria bacterium]|nr:hypothetical protein [Deltaproteobacteria bacterium]
MKSEALKPKSNPFFVALSQSRAVAKPLTPLQQLHADMRKLERIAHVGDHQAWEAQLPLVEQQIEKLYKDPSDLGRIGAQVKIRQHELTLGLKAAERALQKSQEAEQNATSSGDSLASQELWGQAQKFRNLSSYWLGRLRSQSRLLGTSKP